MSYYTIHEFGPIGGYLHQSNYEIRDAKLYNINMVYNRNGQNLFEVLAL